MTTTTNQDPFIHRRAIPRHAPPLPPRTPPIQPPNADPAPTASVKLTRGLFDLIAVMGWVYLAIILITAGLSALLQLSQGHLGVALLMLPGAFVLSIPGVFMIASAQISRSIVDTAEHTRRLVDLLDSRLPK
jgi:hypothetical protein